MSNKSFIIILVFLLITILGLFFLILNPSFIKIPLPQRTASGFQNNGIPIALGFYSITDDQKSAKLLIKLEKVEKKEGKVYGTASFLVKGKNAKITFLFYDGLSSLITKQADVEIYGSHLKNLELSNPEDSYLYMKKLEGKNIVLAISLSDLEPRDISCNSELIAFIKTGNEPPSCAPFIYQLSYYEK